MQFVNYRGYVSTVKFRMHLIRIKIKNLKKEVGINYMMGLPFNLSFND